MKVKDLERTANIAWSPKTQHPIYLAAGTAAQQLDASFNTSSCLELYTLNLGEPGPDMLLGGSVTTEHRFHTLAWGEHNQGAIIGGCDSGLIYVYSPSRILQGEQAPLATLDKHTGAVQALDFNRFQPNLFASGASDSELFVWDLNNTKAPMKPEPRSQPPEPLVAVAWNRQVQHILGSVFATKCVIWDLKKAEPIIKLSDGGSRLRWKGAAWHPAVATQLCLASEEDSAPVIQLWDLRFATSPLKVLEGHQRGVLGLSWSDSDPDLLISTGKDNRILAWNPNSNETRGEVLAEVAHTNQWCFDVKLCPKNPALIGCPCFDGRVSLYSLMGGRVAQVQTTNKIADSFPGMEGMALQAPVPQTQSGELSVDLKKAPKWLKRPAGASFGFGGKLVTFTSIDHSVQVSQVITEAELVQKSNELEQALEYGNFTDYCRSKAEATEDEHKRQIWHFIRANFEPNPRVELLDLLGYRIDDVNAKLANHTAASHELTNSIAALKVGEGDPFAAVKQPVKFQIKTGDDVEGLITQALLLGNVEAAVDLCMTAKRFADAIIIAMTGGSDLLARTQQAYLDQCQGYVSSLISALVSEDWASVINNCELDSWREALAAALTHSTDDTLPILCEQLGNRLENEGDARLRLDSQLCYICSGSFDNLVKSWSLDDRNSTNQLQELVELVVFFQKSIERQGRQVQISGSLADLLSHYASLLASQGDLKTALTYLSLGQSQDEKVVDLKERLCISIGQKQQQALPSNVAPHSRRQSQRASISSGIGGAFPWQQNQVLPQIPQPPQTFSPVPAVVAPPSARPGSTGPQGGAGLPHRKHVLDPSVTSNAYGSSPYQSGPLPQMTSTYQNNGHALGGGYVAPPVAASATNNYVTNPVPLTQPASLFGQSGASNPAFGGQSAAAPTFNQSLMAQPTPPTPFNQSAFSPAVELAQPANERAAYQPTVSAPGWNDPPSLSKAPRNQPKAVTEPAQPITHPLYGANNGYSEVPQQPGYQPPQQGFQPTQHGYQPPQQAFQPPQQGYQPPQSHQQPPPQFQNGPPQLYQPVYNVNPIGPSQTNQNAGIAEVAQPPPKPPTPVEKPPIPEEHMHMKTVLEELKYQCINAANNPQTKRKLEDVSRKLEALYDLLRERKLSSNTLASLHQIVQMIQHGDYPGGLNLHTQLVSGPDFAQIASFMPGIKVLLQCALQLQVYLR